MKAIVPLIFLLLPGSIQLWAQTPVDSLRSTAASLPPGKEKIAVLDKLCETITLSRIGLDTALLYADSLKWVAGVTGIAEGRALGDLYYGIVNRHRGNFREAISFLQRYMDYYLPAADSLRIAEGYYQLGVVYQYNGDYFKSLDAYQRSWTLFDRLGKAYFAACGLVGIGTIYKKQRQWKEGVGTFKKALVIFEELQDTNGAGAVYSNLGDIYVFQKDYPEAEAHYRKSLASAVALNQEYGMADDYDDIGDMLLFQGKYQEALGNYEEALVLRRKVAHQMSTSETLRNIGHVSLKMGQYRKGEAYLREAEQLALKADAKPVLQDVYKYLSEIREKQQDFAGAYQYTQKYVAIKDSIMDTDVARQLNELQVRYETSEKDKQIDLLAKEKELHEKEALRQAAMKKLYTVVFLTVALIGGFLLYIFLQRLRNARKLASKNEEIRQERFQNELRMLELKTLRSQINPHFIFNCMNSINRMVLTGEDENASRYLGKLSRLIRLILENSESEEVLLSSELDLMKSYVEMEQLRFKQKIVYELSLAPEVDAESTYIPSMVLQPFIENAIWHGLMPRQEEGPGLIRVCITRSQDELLVTIADNGVGRARSKELKQNRVLKQKSLGLKITTERLKLLLQSEKENIIQFEDLTDGKGAPAGTKVTIWLPNTQEAA